MLVPVAACSFNIAIGAPHFGQVGALSDTSFPQSEQLINGIFTISFVY